MTGLVYPRFAAYAAEAPGEPCVEDDRGVLDRRGLLREVDRIAAALARLRPADGPVGVHLPRDRRLVAALLAIDAVDAAFLPLDPLVPISRLRAFLSDSRARLVLTSSELADALGPGPWDVLDVDQAAVDGRWEPGASGDGDQTAYIMYTSGSTGEPKGVAVGRRSVAHFLTAMDDEVTSPGERQVWQAVCSVGFDVSVIDFFWVLSRGHFLALGPNDPVGLFGSALARGTAAGPISHVVMTPSTARLLCHDPATLAGLRRARMVMIGGEPFPSELVDVLRDGDGRPRLVNVYGPTEATVWITRTDVTESCAPPGFAGSAITCAALRVLDEDLGALPSGTEGRLFLAGPTVAYGYWKRGGLTAAAFLPDPAGHPGARMYDTGDRAFLDADGRLTLNGRSDRQVKIRGNRVELGEIEHALCRVPAVRSAACVLMPADGLTAFVTVGDPAADDVEAAVRGRLAELLPAYMIPNRVVVVDEMPQVPSGKIDRAALERWFLATTPGAAGDGPSDVM